MVITAQRQPRLAGALHSSHSRQLESAGRIAHGKDQERDDRVRRSAVKSDRPSLHCALVFSADSELAQREQRSVPGWRGSVRSARFRDGLGGEDRAQIDDHADVDDSFIGALGR